MAFTSSTPITLDLFKQASREFIDGLVEKSFPDLYGVSDGKAIGTRIEDLLKDFLSARFDLTHGSSAYGLDFPSLNTDLKVTSLKHPQSSCPFRSATQKIYGLGYNLLVIVYSKLDDRERKVATFDVHSLLFIPAERTADFTLTRLILDVLTHANNVETAVQEIDALLQDKQLPLEDVSRLKLAEEIVSNPPQQGYLTISNALQWRLQYGRAMEVAQSNLGSSGVEELKHGE